MPDETTVSLPKKLETLAINEDARPSPGSAHDAVSAIMPRKGAQPGAGMKDRR